MARSDATPLQATVMDAQEVLRLHAETERGKFCAACTVNRRVPHPCRYARLAMDWMRQNTKRK